MSPIHYPVFQEDSGYLRSQEARRKDIETLFGVLFARSRTRQVNNVIWLIEIIINVSQTGVVLRNMIVRMQQDGLVSEALDEKRTKQNILTELYY